MKAAIMIAALFLATGTVHAQYSDPYLDLDISRLRRERELMNDQLRDDQKRLREQQEQMRQEMEGMRQQRERDRSISCVLYGQCW
jgi:hypothetical protein